MADKLVIPTTEAALREQQTAHKAFQQYYESRFVLTGSQTVSNGDDFFLGIDGRPTDTVLGLPDNFLGNLEVISLLAVNSKAEEGIDREVATVSVDGSGTVTLTTAAGTDFGAGDDGIVVDLTTNDVRLDIQRVTNGLKFQVQGYTAASSEVALGYVVVSVKGAVMASGDNFINEFPLMTLV